MTLKSGRLAFLQSNWNEITDNFDDMNLKETLLRGIYAYGFEKPSAIQQRAIIPCIKGTVGAAGGWDAPRVVLAGVRIMSDSV